MALQPAPTFLAGLAAALLAAAAWARWQDRREGRRPDPEPRAWVLVGACLLGAVWTGGYPLAAAAALLAVSLSLAGAGAWSLTPHRRNLPRAASCFVLGLICAQVAGLALPA